MDITIIKSILIFYNKNLQRVGLEPTKLTHWVLSPAPLTTRESLHISLSGNRTPHSALKGPHPNR